jgi:hypothetical protein
VEGPVRLVVDADGVKSGIGGREGGVDGLLG